MSVSNLVQLNTKHKTRKWMVTHIAKQETWPSNLSIIHTGMSLLLMHSHKCKYTQALTALGSAVQCMFTGAAMTNLPVQQGTHRKEQMACFRWHATSNPQTVDMCDMQVKTYNIPAVTPGAFMGASPVPQCKLIQYPPYHITGTVEQIIGLWQQLSHSFYPFCSHGMCPQKCGGAVARELFNFVEFHQHCDVICRVIACSGHEVDPDLVCFNLSSPVHMKMESGRGWQAEQRIMLMEMTPAHVESSTQRSGYLTMVA